MKNLSPSSMAILQRVEALRGRPIEFRPDMFIALHQIDPTMGTCAHFAARYIATLDTQSAPPKTQGA